VDIHFIHVKSPHADALPLIMTHGWPGSVIELLEVVDPLTNPTAHGGRAEDAFDLVLPSLPGYGFSGEPTEVGWDPARVARAWAELMHRLGYTRYVAQGGDVGAIVTRRHRPPGTRGAGRHPHQLARDGVGGSRAGGVRTGTGGGRRARHIQDERQWLLPGTGHAAADDDRHAVAERHDEKCREPADFLPQQGRHRRPPDDPGAPHSPSETNTVRRCDRLGGLLHEYQQVA
jgi:hypothetical protein